MNAAQVGAFTVVNDKRQAEFAQNVFKVPRFDACVGGNRVAVHRVARPDD